MSDQTLIEPFLGALAEALDPLRGATTVKGAAALLAEIGFAEPPGVGIATAFGQLAAAAEQLVNAVAAARAAGEGDEQALAAVAVAAARALEAVTAVATALSGNLDPTYITTSGLATEAPRRLLDKLIGDYLRHRMPAVLRLLQLLGLADLVFQLPDPQRHRVTAAFWRIEWERIPRLFANPVEVFDAAYRDAGVFQAEKMVIRIARFLAACEAPVSEFWHSPAIAAALGQNALRRPDYAIALFSAGDFFDTTAYAECGLRLSAIPAGGGLQPAVAITPYAVGAAGITGEITPGWFASVQATAALLDGGLALLWRPGEGFTVRAGLTGTGITAAGQVRAALKRDAGTGTEITLLGKAGRTRLSMRALEISLTSVLNPPSLEIALDVTELVLVLKPEGDGFLAKILPPEGLASKLDFGMTVCTATGLRFRGSPGLEFDRDIGLDIAGVLRLDRLFVRAIGQDSGLLVEFAVTASLRLGPVAATVERLGLGAALKPPPAGQALGPHDIVLGRRGPAGLALKVTSGPVNGGGYLFFDPDKGQYAGALQLGIKAISLSAIGLLSTKLPSGQPGFSLLVIIAAEFPSIPLPFGFALNGVGGLVGIHRRMDTEALKLKVSEGVLGSILFPQDPVGRIQTVLSDLRTVFPVQEGRHVFGPMVKLTWGPGALLRMELAIILDIPSPLRLVILGRIRLVLPTETDAIADIKLEVAGFIDFDRQEASVAAALVDSRLAGFTLTGDMAMFLGWGATKAFAVSMGGFFPGFTPPPGMPPRMRRLALGLTSGDNPRLTLETYFAVTSNTVQFGARAELYAATDTFAGTFAAQGMASFDALIQFEPFGFLAQLRALLCILRNGSPILSAELQANLSGPKPWHAEGFVEFQIVVKVRVPFEVTAGEPEQIPPPVVNLFDLLLTEVGRKESWASAPAPEAGTIASLRDRDPAAGIVLHPLSSVTLLQRQMPFEKVLNRFGAARPDGSAPRFTLEQIGVGASSSAPTTAFADFAPGQFDDLTEDEKISRPAFEAMPAGGAAVIAAFKAPAARTTAAGAAGQSNWADGFQDIVLEGTTRSASRVSTGFGLAFPQDGPVERALRARGTGIQVASESYALADVDSLEVPNFAAYAGSRAQAEDLWKALDPADRARYTVAPTADTWINP